MYGKIFDSIYDGTLAEDWRALITFQQFIVLCDADGVVDMTPSAISRRTGIPIEHIKAGIEILEKPDPFSRTEGDEGRRIRLLDDHRPWGWFITNHDKYKGLQDADTVRAQNRERKRKQRAKQKDGHKASRDVTDGHGQSRHTDTDTDTDTKADKSGACAPAPSGSKKKDSGNCTMKTFIESCKQDGEKAIPGNDPVFRYSEDANLPGEFVWLAWREFVARHIDRDKKYKGKRGWRQAFGNCVRANWYELWAVGDNGYFLTKQGRQAQLAHKDSGND